MLTDALSPQAEEHRATAEAYRSQNIQKEHEERRKTLQVETDEHHKRAQYQDELARKRSGEEMEKQRRLNAEYLQKQREQQREQAEHQAMLERQNLQAKTNAEWEGRIKAERANRDIRLEELKANASEARQTSLERLKTGSAIFGAGVNDFLSDKTKVTATVLALSGLALGIFGARTATGVIGRQIESRLGKPTLVRETSRNRSLFAQAKEMLTQRKADSILDGIVLNPALEARLGSIATATINTKKHAADYRNLLLAGPPGTGKTLFGKKLAHSSGIHYAVMTGGDVGPLGTEAVTEIHKMFDWAETTRSGMLLFIDEAEAFLQTRTSSQISEPMRNALNAFLYRTGTASDKFMLVLSTNRPEDLDRALRERIDESLWFDLPGLEERLRLLQQYFTHYIAYPKKKSADIDYSEVDVPKVLGEIAARTQGFSGRNISQLMLAIQGAVYGSSSNKLTEEMINDVVELKISQNELNVDLDE